MPHLLNGMRTLLGATYLYGNRPAPSLFVRYAPQALLCFFRTLLNDPVNVVRCRYRAYLMAFRTGVTTRSLDLYSYSARGVLNHGSCLRYITP